jgi:hypothetical protein
MQNKKIKNATECEYKGIHFKSTLEMNTYKTLIENGFSPEYEQHTFTLWEGKNLSVPCYDLHKDRKIHKNVWGLNNYKPANIKYTPDFVLLINQRLVIIESKGYPNDRYIYVKKLFRSYLQEKYPDSLFFEIHNKKQLLAAIQIIKTLD